MRVNKICIAGVLALAACATGACSEPESQQMKTIPESPATESVRKYVETSRGWTKDSYRIEPKGSADGQLVLWVVHKDDEHSLKTGGGKSFSVRVDPATYQVLRELHFQ